MDLEIKGFVPNTLIDWEGKVASIIFLPGCNFRCPFCYAVDLVLHPNKLETVPFEEINSFLKKKANWVDGLVICGGEPTASDELPELIRKFKDLPTLVKLDTNGTNPKMLKSLIEDGLIDYVAMDLKAPMAKYDEVAGAKVDPGKIKEAINILINCDIDYEFRTTVCPAFLKKENILEMAKSIAGARRYILQQFRPGECLDPKLNEVRPYPTDVLREMVDGARAYVPNAYLRGEKA